MIVCRKTMVAGLVVMASAVSLDSASARHRHHARHLEPSPPRQFVFQSPASADTTVFAGKVAGYLSPGILGATTADPYERPGYGYYVGGGRGPGYLYEGE